MKKLITSTIVLLFLVNLQVSAQQEIHLNVSNVFLYEFNMAYEHALNDNLTLGGFGGYVYGFPEQSYENKFWYLGPEVRYYTSPRYGADRFFFGFYARIKDGYAENEYSEGGQLISTGQYESFYWMGKQDYTKVAVGLSLGAKWVTNKGLTYGFFGGFGRNLVSSYSNEDYTSHEDLFVPGTYYQSEYSSGTDSKYWDVRVGFNLGWRF